MDKLECTLEQLRHLLDEQKELTIDKLLNQSSYYNGENTEGCSNSMKINADQFKKNGSGY